jgi:hypothetical protein
VQRTELRLRVQARKRQIYKSRFEAASKREAMGEFLRDLWEFMRVRKKFWLLPIVIVLLLLGGLVLISQQSALGAFIYTLF